MYVCIEIMFLWSSSHQPWNCCKVFIFFNLTENSSSFGNVFVNRPPMSHLHKQLHQLQHHIYSAQHRLAGLRRIRCGFTLQSLVVYLSVAWSPLGPGPLLAHAHHPSTPAHNSRAEVEESAHNRLLWCHPNFTYSTVSHSFVFSPLPRILIEQDLFGLGDLKLFHHNAQGNKL